jgi:hypothetical protein
MAPKIVEIVLKPPKNTVKEMRNDAETKKNYLISKSFAIHRLIRYVEILYKYLNAIEMCFVAGSFVIEDKDEEMLDILILSSSLCLRGASSHTSLNPKQFDKTIDNIRYVCKNVSETHIEGNVTGNLIQILCSHMKNVEGDVIEDTRNIKNIKWYKFLNGENKNFIFFKLEKTITCSVAHCFDAIDHYNGNPEQTIYPSRREDCKTKCQNGNPDFKKNVNGLIINGNLKPEIIETYNRVGDEFFIPQELNDYFLIYANNQKRINQIDIKKDISTDIVSLTGGKKNLRYKKKPLYKNNAKNKPI